MTNPPILQARNLSCARQQKLLFSQLSFAVKAGQILLIEGANGIGKSSLLRLLAGIATPLKGEIFWCQQSIAQSPLAYWENLHYVGHTNGIKLGLTVVENLQLAHSLALTETTFDLSALLSRLKLDALENTQATYLSAGQKRRLALARLLLIQKPLWLLDEPLTTLDTDTQTFFLSEFETHAHKGGIIVMSSHHAIQFSGSISQTLRLNAC